ncbi:hypothetical protein PsYK624_077460 [Phanerochaete sordida]|uniref:Uncharacterized protein n=1 Tax=Phanerochaete sordida TaxID=48140 RepID=A0A9P3GB21_9APHY|nr:hypothetical protein PsYK624_077460 [Phanerochaete sordida]
MEPSGAIALCPPDSHIRAVLRVPRGTIFLSNLSACGYRCWIRGGKCNLALRACKPKPPAPVSLGPPEGVPDAGRAMWPTAVPCRHAEILRGRGRLR